MTRIIFCFVLVLCSNLPLNATAQDGLVNYTIPPTQNMNMWTARTYLEYLIHYQGGQTLERNSVPQQRTDDAFADKRANAELFNELKDGAAYKFEGINLSDIVFEFIEAPARLFEYDFGKKEYVVCIPAIWFYGSGSAFEVRPAKDIWRIHLCNQNQDLDWFSFRDNGKFSYGEAVAFTMPNDDTAERLFSISRQAELLVSAQCKWTEFHDNRMWCYLSKVDIWWEGGTLMTLEWDGGQGKFIQTLNF